MNFSHNKIENLCDLCPKRLRKLNLSHNPLKFLEGFSGHKQLQILELRATNLKQTLEPSTKLPNLTHLYLSAIEAFEITNLVLPALPSLETLHLRGTPVETLDLKDSPNLKYLNMRETKVSKIEFLNNLIKKCTKLEVVIMSGTPMEEEGEVGDLKKALQIKTIELSPLSPENGGI
jgi:Leucine-rich repeat (LRR) protein